MLDLDLGKSIYSKVQVEEFLKFQDFQGTMQTYLTEPRGWPMEDAVRTGPGALGWGSMQKLSSLMQWGGLWYQCAA
jgi:hypothetical protein